MTMLKVKDAMKKGVVFVNEETPIIEVARIIITNNIGSVLVYGKEKGIISKTDLIKKVILENKNPLKTKAKEIKNKELITINKEENLKKAAELIKNKKIGRLIVVDDENKIIGVLSKSDLISLEPELIDLFEEYDEIIGLTEENEINDIQISGYCDDCGEYFEELYKYGDMILCKKCLEERI